MKSPPSTNQNQQRKSLPWEQQHISSVRVVGIVRQVIPISFREIHFIIDCDAAKQQQQQQQQNNNNNNNNQRNWVDVHACDTWAARCAVLVEGDRVELQNFGVFRPVVSSSSNNNNNNNNNNKTEEHHLRKESSSSTIQFWQVPESRMSATPFVLSPVVFQGTTTNNNIQTNNNNDIVAKKKSNSNKLDVDLLQPAIMSTFIVERGQKLILHDDDNENRSDASGKIINENYKEEELNFRTQGSHTAQQLFMKSVKASSGSNDEDDTNNDSSSSSNKMKGQKISSIGNAIGKNLFSNAFRFVDVMRGLNKNLLPLLKRIQRTCASAQHVLDAGCGSGLISFAIKCSDPMGAEIVATDRSRAMSALVQEKNVTFAGLIKSHLSSGARAQKTNLFSPSQQQRKQQQQQQDSFASNNNNNNNGDAAPPLVQFVLGDLSASPDRFIILPSGASPTEVVVGGRKQFDVLLCIDVLSYLPSIEAMKRALFNLALHAKPNAKLLLSVPNLLSSAEDATKLGATSSTLSTNNNNNSNDQQNNFDYNDPEQRPKIQRSLHFEYDRHKLSLGSSTHLSQGGVLDVIERQYFELNSLESLRKQQQMELQPASYSTKTDNKLSSDIVAGGVNENPSKNVLKRFTEWFGFSCPNPSSFAQHFFTPSSTSTNNKNNSNNTNNSKDFQPNSNTGLGTPQIFYENLEEIVLHPTLLESLFEEMGWRVEEVWLFNALERGGEFADPGINTMAILGSVPGGSSQHGIGRSVMLKHSQENTSTMVPMMTMMTDSSGPISPQSNLLPSPAQNSNNSSQRVGFDDAATKQQNEGLNHQSAAQVEAGFTHRLYTLVRKSS